MPDLQPRMRVAHVVVVACCAFYLWRNVIAVMPYLRSGASDFTNYFLAARALLEGQSPFSVANFDYPALLAFVVAPIAWLSEPAARMVWFGFSHLCLLTAGVVLWRRLGADRLALVAVTTVWAFGGTVAENLALGQVNPLLLVLLAGSWSRAWQARPPSAAMVGAAAAVKLWPLALLVKDGLIRRWRSVVAGLLTALALVGLPLAFVAIWLPHPHGPPRASYWMGTPALLNFSIPAVMLRLLEPPRGRRALPDSWVVGNDPGRLVLPHARTVIGAATGLLLFGLGLWLLARRARKCHLTRDDEAVASAALVALALAAAPIAWYHYQLMNFLGGALLAERWLRRRRYGALVALGCTVLGASWAHVGLVAPYVARYGWTGANPAWLWLATSVAPVAGIILFGMLVREIGHERFEKREHALRGASN